MFSKDEIVFLWFDYNGYSFLKLEKILKAEGIHISRRTIAKYRKQMGLENSYKRNYR